MFPFLAIFSGRPGESFSELLQCLEKETPVDFLFIDSSDTNNPTYRYTTSQNILQDIQEIMGDYNTVLLVGDKTQEVFNAHCKSIISNEKNSLWQIDPLRKKVHCKEETDLDLLRYFFIKGFQVYCNDTLQSFKGLTLSELTLITNMICLKDGDQLDTLLRREAILYFPQKPTSLNAYKYLQIKETAMAEGVLEIADESSSEKTNRNLPVFILLQPTLHLWVYTKAFATAGSIDYDLKKLLKEIHRHKEEVKFGAFSPEACLNDHIFSFMDNFEADNELELAFNLVTIRPEIEAFAKTKGLNLLGDRSSKTSRLLILSAEKREL